MKLIFAQGNPGSKYDGTRHNVGFMILDAFAAKHGLSFSAKPKFSADIAEISINGEKIVLAKPTTYYNETGQSARALVDFYKLDPSTDILVLHDDLALPFGTLRTRGRGSDAGNNGIKSLNAHLDEHYSRLRVGIQSEREHISDIDFVLGAFTATERDMLPNIYVQALVVVEAFIADQLSHTTVTHPEV